MLQKIYECLEDKGFTDYHTLSDPQALSLYEELLDKFLKEASQKFDKLLHQSESSVTFESLLDPFFEMGEQLGILFGFLVNLDGTNSSDQTRKIIESFKPKYTEYNTKITMDETLYKLLKSVKKNHANLNTQLKLNDQQIRSIDLLIRDMEIAGVHLQGAPKKRLEAINMELSKLSTAFSNHVLDSRKQFHYHFKSDEFLQDVPEQALLAAKEEAKSRDLKGWVFTLEPPSTQAIMKYCDDPNVRQLFFHELSSIASSGEYDNRGLILEILKLRQEKAELLKFKNYAEYILQSRMANHTEEVEEKLKLVGESARKKAIKDLKELQEFSKLQTIEYWDIAFYSDKLMHQKYQINEKELKKYFPLDPTLQGLFEISNILFGLKFKPVEVPSYNDDILNYEVHQNGELKAYFIFDLFARKSKQGGAWCGDLRGQKKRGSDRQIPIMVNVSNFGKSLGATPTLLTHNEVTTLFHEFGHAMHVILSDNDYENLSGFATEWDFVELPSQLMENWSWEQESLSLFAKHFETNEPIPDHILQPLKEARSFMSGYQVLRQNEFGFLDWLLHTEPTPQTVEELDQTCLAIAQQYSLLPKPENYRMYCSFGHIFAGGYAAGYYSYLWAEILEADIFGRFLQEGILNQEIGALYQKTVLAAGAKKPAADIFHDFMGREPDIEALKQKYHFQ